MSTSEGGDSAYLGSYSPPTMNSVGETHDRSFYVRSRRDTTEEDRRE